jgi:hypothetical protein
MTRRLATAVVVGLMTAAIATGCGKTDNQVPTAPAVSRAEPTGTVNTTVPASTTTKG